jgi:CBS-domain-containing membrane protein
MSDSQQLQSTTTEPTPERRKIGIKGEISLALLPTITILLVLATVETFSNQRLLFASLASSAFLIYLDPKHGTNTVRSLVLSQVLAALAGFAAFNILGPGYWSAAGAMIVVIIATILLDAVHPPAISTALAFAFRSGPETNLVLFGFALLLLVILVGLQRASIWVLAKATHSS